MLEYNFNELDNDFITCWSKYLLTGDIKLIIKDLEKLAELGQINAMQEWYKFRKLGDNPIIDKNTKDLGDTYNELFLKARIESKDERLNDYHKNLLDLVDEKEYISAARTGYYELTNRAKMARKNVKNICYIDNYGEAANKAYEMANRTNDAVILETFNEIYLELANKIGINDISNQIKKTVKRSNRLIINNLSKKMNKVKKEDGKYVPNLYPSISYSFAKAVLLFNDNHRKKDFALYILNDLANRKYSDKLIGKVNKQ